MVVMRLVLIEQIQVRDDIKCAAAQNIYISLSSLVKWSTAFTDPNSPPSMESQEAAKMYVS